MGYVWEERKKVRNMKGWMGWLIGIGGGYLVLKYLGIDPLASVEGLLKSSTTTTPVSSSTTVQASTTSVVAPNTPLLVRQAMQKDGLDPSQLYSFDQWNYYYERVRGISGPDPAQYLTTASRDAKLSQSEWWGYMQSAGFSGLGTVTNMNPYTNQYTPGRGMTILPLKTERLSKVY